MHRFISIIPHSMSRDNCGDFELHNYVKWKSKNQKNQKQNGKTDGSILALFACLSLMGGGSLLRKCELKHIWGYILSSRILIFDNLNVQVRWI